MALMRLAEPDTRNRPSVARLRRTICAICSSVLRGVSGRFACKIGALGYPQGADVHAAIPHNLLERRAKHNARVHGRLHP